MDHLIVHSIDHNDLQQLEDDQTLKYTSFSQSNVISPSDFVLLSSHYSIGNILRQNQYMDTTIICIHIMENSLPSSQHDKKQARMSICLLLPLAFIKII